MGAFTANPTLRLDVVHAGVPTRSLVCPGGVTEAHCVVRDWTPSDIFAAPQGHELPTAFAWLVVGHPSIPLCLNTCHATRPPEGSSFGRVCCVFVEGVSIT